MIRLLLLLLGAEVVQRRWRALLVIGAVWAALSLFIMLDALDGATLIRPHYFGYLLLLEGLISLLAGMVATQRRTQQLAKAVILLLPALIIIAQPRHSNMLIAMLLGGVMLCDGTLRIASAWVVRFDNWRMAMAAGIVEIILAIITLEPWPTWYEGTIGFNVGALLIISGWGTILLANRLRKLPPDAPISMLIGGAFPTALWVPAKPDDAGHDDLIVHVWTPAGPGRHPRRRPIVDRYIAAIDHRGRISTGHAALELAPNVYISHYPAVEIDRSRRNSAACCVRASTTTFPAASCRAIARKPMAGARPPSMCISRGSTACACAISGAPIAATPPTISPAATARAPWRMRSMPRWKACWARPNGHGALSSAP